MTFEFDGVLIRPTVVPTQSERMRKRFATFLVRNLKESALQAGITDVISRAMDPYFFLQSRNVQELLAAVSQVFGVESFSPAIISPLQVDAIVEKCRQMLRNDVSFSEIVITTMVDNVTHDTFRTELLHKLESDEFQNQNSSGSLHIELASAQACLSIEKRDGLGGLPTGFQGRVVIMISAGLDSPIAAFKAIRRGCTPVFVHFDNSPFSDESNVELAIRQARHLTRFVHGEEVKMYVVPHGDDLTEVLKHAPRKMTCIFCRRNMYRLAREIAIREGATAIVTGEIIGEQASQTTRNLLAESSSVCDISIIRPCIGDDKSEIEKMARKIGTYDFAKEAVACCALPPKYPTIHANIEEIAPAEEKMDLRWLNAEISEARVIVLKEAGSVD